MTGERIAIVTGAGSGIGRACSLALMKAGFTVVLTGRRQEKLKETAELGRLLGRSLVVSSDLTDPDSIDALFAETTHAFGRLDLLFNSAGIVTPAMPLENITIEQWQGVISTNLTAPFLCTQRAFRIMKDQLPRGGRIINNGSISAYAPRPMSSPYTATKHAISGLTRSTALDGREYDIACGQIDIGNAATELTEGIVNGVLQPSGAKMVEPSIDVQNVADALVFMATRPLDTNVLFMNVMATKMPFVGRG
jgi:NAD(P)-dependent dehydrogenase (short-subunit alcohol dehydrogenase family)